MTDRKHGCNNTRKQVDGYWTESAFHPQYVEDRMTSGCQWRIENADSPGCIGCREKMESVK